MKLTTGYKKPIASSGTDALELSSNNSYLLLAGGGHKALSELVSPADLTTELSNYVTIGSNQTITGVKTFSLAINADISGNADTVDGEHAVAFAHIGAHNNLTVNNEFTFVSNGFSGDIWFNYRTAGGTNGNITDYIFGNGKGGQLYSLKTIATNASTAYSWGNHANVGYLLRSDIGSLSVNYATNAGNAGTLNGHTSDDFVLKTTYDVYESVIVESLNDLDSRKIEVSDLPTSLPANGGHAATATNVDWSGVTNKPSSLPANGGNADTINGYSSSDFVLNTNYGEFKSVVATALTDLDSRKIDKEDGKGLSTNDYTTEEKTKLAGIEEGAQVNDPNTVIDANYVHTDNNYTTAEKNKLSGIEIGALVNTVNSVAGKTGDVTLNVSNISGLQSALDGKQDNLEFTSAPSSSNKVVTQNELNSTITGQSSYLGTIESVSSLLTTAKKGDFYRVKTAWDGVHVGDLIIAEKDNPAAIIDEINWSLLHNEMDTDTTYTFEDGIDGFSVTPSVGNKQKVNISVGYATSAGNAETLGGKNANDFIQNITVDPVTTVAPGSEASVTTSKINSDVTLHFTIPRGADGTDGKDGKDGVDGVSPTISIGTVTTVDAGNNAEVSKSGTDTEVVLNFTIPRGANGDMWELEDDNGGTNVSDYCEVSRVWQILHDPNLSVTFADKIQVPVPSVTAMAMDADCIKQKTDIELNVGEEIIKSQYTWKELHWLLRCSNTDCIVYTTKYATPHGGAAQYPSIDDGGNVQYPPNIIEISVNYDKNLDFRYVQVTIENMYGRAYYRV